MKRTNIFLATAALLVSSTAIAGGSNCGKTVMPYMGIQLGAGFMDTKMSTTNGNGSDLTGNKLSYISGGTPSGNAFMGGIHLGVDYAMSSAYCAGIEASFDFLSSAKAKHTTTYRTLGAVLQENGNVISAQQRHRINIAARLKYAMNDTTCPYVKIGYSNASFRLESTLNGADIADTAQRSVRKTKRLGGLLLGAGVDMKASDAIRVGLEYTYTRYAKATLSHAFKSTGSADDESINRTYKPQTSAVQVRMSYMF